MCKMYNFSEYFAIFKPCNCSKKLFLTQSSPSYYSTFSISTKFCISSNFLYFFLFFQFLSPEMTCWGDVYCIVRCSEVFLERLLVTVTVSDSLSPSYVEVLSLVTYRGGLSCTCYNPQLVTPDMAEGNITF